MERKFWVTAAEACNQMIFETLDGALISVSEMKVRRGELEGDTFMFHQGFYSFRAPVVKGLKNRAQTSSSQLRV